MKIWRAKGVCLVRPEKREKVKACRRVRANELNFETVCVLRPLCICSVRERDSKIRTREILGFDFPAQFVNNCDVIRCLIMFHILFFFMD